MTVVQSYICEKLSKTIPKFSDIPAHVGNLLVHGIAVNSAYTSRVMVRTHFSDIFLNNAVKLVSLIFIVKIVF